MDLVDWDQCFSVFCYGIKRYYLKEDHLAPETGY